MTTDITHSRQLDTCLITAEPVTKVLDFGQHAYADTFVSQDQLNLSEPVFPLQVHLNPNSGMLQLGYVSNAEARYNLYSYSYTSSNSKTARDHSKGIIYLIIFQKDILSTVSVKRTVCSGAKL